MEVDEIKGYIQHILNYKFVGEKRIINQSLTSNELRFSCPFCNDSEMVYKKRGNLFLLSTGWFYFCYNCNIKHTMKSFLTHFNPVIRAKKINILL